MKLSLAKFGSVSSEEMLEGPLFGKIVRFTVPIILTGVLQLLFNAADLIVVGQFCGEDSVAAVGATGALINLIVNLFIGLSVGAGVMTARSIGAGRNEDSFRVVHTSIPVAVISGAVLTAVGLVLCRPLLIWMDTPADVLDLSVQYMEIYFAGMIGSMVFNFGAAILRAAGNTQGPLVYLTLSGILNVILNVIFVALFHMNVAGVALATAITQCLSAVLVALALIRRTDALHLDLRKLHVYSRTLWEIVRIGLPAGIQGMLFSISNVLIQSSVNSFGKVVVSGNSAAANIEGFVYVSMNSIHQTALNFSGQNGGAQRFDRVKKVTTICLIMVTVIGLFLGVLAYAFGTQLLSLYLPEAPEAIEYGLLRMAIFSVTYFLCGINDTMTGSLRGIGASFVPMVISVLGICAFRVVWIETVFQMAEYHTLNCLYLSYPISWILTFAAELICFVILIRRQQRKIREKGKL